MSSPVLLTQCHRYVPLVLVLITVFDKLIGAEAAELRSRARNLGQTEADRSMVRQYLDKLNRLMDERHPGKDVKPVKIPGDDPLAARNPGGSWRSRFHDDVVEEDENPEESGKFYEGDIILFPDQARAIYENALKHGRRRTKRKFIGSTLRRWDPKKPIEYSFDGSHTLREQKIIELALEHWHNITCLNFIRRNDEPHGNRIVFTDVDGCASNVGRHPLGEPQFVSLAPECIRVAHALGFWHEMSRADRDIYVQVQWENVDRDSKGQFSKEQPIDVDNADIPYDYGSIMQYRSKAFARYDDLYTIKTYIADYQKTIGQRDQLSFNDIRLMNKIYCSETCPLRLSCQRGGYPDPRKCDRCRCPDGFTGQLCEEVMPGFGSECGGRIEMSSRWQRISSPGYPTEFKEGQECSWLLVAPPGQHVHLQFFGEFEMYCKVRHSLCMDYVEIRNSTDFANTGMRYCCYGTPTSPVYSATEDLLVLFRSFYRGGKGFQAQARSVPTSGSWSAWGQWSTCSASCGACGLRQRSRKCSGTICLGAELETEVCNNQPCSLCEKQKFDQTNCGGFLALLGGSRCKAERTVLEPCDTSCCPGFTVRNGICTPNALALSK